LPKAGLQVNERDT